MPLDDLFLMTVWIAGVCFVLALGAWIAEVSRG